MNPVSHFPEGKLLEMSHCADNNDERHEVKDVDCNAQNYYGKDGVRWDLDESRGCWSEHAVWDDHHRDEGS